MVNRDNIADHLLDYELSIIGKDRLVLIDDDKWRFNNTLTRSQYNDFKKYAVGMIQKVFKCNKKKANDNFQWFYMRFGLRIKN